MKIGCCIDISWYDQLVNLGYDSISLAAKDIVSWDETTFLKAKERIKRGPLKTISLNSFCTADLRLNGRGFDLNRIEEYTDLVCRRGKELGFRYIGIGAPQSRNVRESENREVSKEQFLKALRCMCQTAEQYEMEILLEAVCSVECNFITTTWEALDLIQKAGFERVHLVYDIYHEYMERQPLSVIKEAANEIKVVHIAQNINGYRAYLLDEYLNQYRAYWNALKEIGYTGEWNLECFAGDPAVELSNSLNIMKELSGNCAGRSQVFARGEGEYAGT